jgi:hypothetical protein
LQSLKLFAWALLGIVLLLLFLMIDWHPAVWHDAAETGKHVMDARDLWAGNHEEKGADQLRSIALSEDDLHTVANFALQRKKWAGYSRVAIRGNRLFLEITLRLPLPWLFLNFKLVAEDGQPQAEIREMRLGNLVLPSPVVRWLGRRFMESTPLGRYGQITAPLIREVRIGDQRLTVRLNWNRETLDDIQKLASDYATRERTAVYHRRLGEFLQKWGPHRYVTLGNLQQSLFGLARERTQAGADAVEENRAVVLVLGAYVNRRQLIPLIPEPMDAKSLPTLGVLLNRRVDTAQHFMASAVLAISGHRALADMIGLAKEINDTHSGSGFSFTDLLADRAGARFGKQVVKNREDAIQAQNLLAASADETPFMPSLRGLPENLGPEEFGRRFGDLDSPSYQQLKQAMEDRIEACALYH